MLEIFRLLQNRAEPQEVIEAFQAVDIKNIHSSLYSTVDKNIAAKHFYEAGFTCIGISVTGGYTLELQEDAWMQYYNILTLSLAQALIKRRNEQLCLQLIPLMVEKGLDVNHVYKSLFNNAEHTFLDDAVAWGNRPVAELLLSFGAKTTRPTELSPLHQMIENRKNIISEHQALDCSIDPVIHHLGDTKFKL